MNAPHCLICTLNPLSRRDFDGLCVSCRASVASGLYRVTWVERQDGTRRRVIERATSADDVLGVEYPGPDPIPYDPSGLPAEWRKYDREQAEVARAETVLNLLEGDTQCG